MSKHWRQTNDQVINILVYTHFIRSILFKNPSNFSSLHDKYHKLKVYFGFLLMLTHWMDCVCFTEYFIFSNCELAKGCPNREKIHR